MFQVVENGNGKQFAMKRIMVNNEADLKLAKQEIAVMVRGGEGRGGERRKGEGRGRRREGGGEGRGVGRGEEWEGRGEEESAERRGGREEGEGRERPCTDGVSLIVLRSGHLPTTATQSPSTTGPSAARVTIFMRSSL